MSDITILHNPRCSKSRQTLALIQEKGIDPEVVEYLKNPLTVEQLQGILDKLQLTAKDLVRKNEDAYKTLTIINPTPSENDLLNWMAANPVLIERPIVIKGDNAIIGRPPENVHDLL